MNFQEKILDALIQVEKGCSLKDFLTDDEILEALGMLGDILICTGVRLPPEDA
jgi:hypothetical protein